MLINFRDMFRRHNIRAAGCLHLGASSGQERDTYASLGIQRVIWVEALPDVFKKLERNISGFHHHRAIQACLSDVDGERVMFNVANNEGQSSSYLEFGTHAVQHPDTLFTSQIEMTTIRLDTLLDIRSLTIGKDWFLNVDVQGAELKVLKGMGQRLWDFKYAYVEVNEDELYKGCPRTADIDAFLAGFGFKGVETKMMKQGWGDRLYLRK